MGLVFYTGSYVGGATCAWSFDAINNIEVLNEAYNLKSVNEQAYKVLEECNYSDKENPTFINAIEPNIQLEPIFAAYQSLVTYADPKVKKTLDSKGSQSIDAYTGLLNDMKRNINDDFVLESSKDMPNYILSQMNLMVQLKPNCKDSFVYTIEQCPKDSVIGTSSDAADKALGLAYCVAIKDSDWNLIHQRYKDYVKLTDTE